MGPDLQSGPRNFQIEFDSDDGFDTDLFGVVVEPDCSVESVVVRKRKGLAADLPGSVEKRLNGAACVEEAEVRVYV